MTNVDPSDGVGFMSEIENYGYVKDYPLDLRKKDGSIHELPFDRNNPQE